MIEKWLRQSNFIYPFSEWKKEVLLHQFLSFFFFISCDELFNTVKCIHTHTLAHTLNMAAVPAYSEWLWRDMHTFVLLAKNANQDVSAKEKHWLAVNTA